MREKITNRFVFIKEMDYENYQKIFYSESSIALSFGNRQSLIGFMDNIYLLDEEYNENKKYKRIMNYCRKYIIQDSRVYGKRSKDILELIKTHINTFPNENDVNLMYFLNTLVTTKLINKLKPIICGIYGKYTNKHDLLVVLASYCDINTMNILVEIDHKTLLNLCISLINNERDKKK